MEEDDDAPHKCTALSAFQEQLFSNWNVSTYKQLLAHLNPTEPVYKYIILLLNIHKEDNPSTTKLETSRLQILRKSSAKFERVIVL